MEVDNERHQCALYWYADCLGAVAVLALGFNRKQQQRLARKFGLAGGQEGADPALTLLALHEACHRDERLIRAVTRELGTRFGEMGRKVRGSGLAEIKELQSDYALPLLWATLNDPREEVRIYGRVLLHGVFLRALAGQRAPADGGEEKLRTEHFEQKETIRAFKAENRTLKARIKELERQVQKMQRASETARDQRQTRQKVESEAVSGGQTIGTLEREIRKLSYALEKERERAAEAERELQRIAIEGLPKASEQTAEPRGEDRVCAALPPAMTGGSSRATVVCPGNPICPERGECSMNCPLKDLKVAILGGTERTLPEYRCLVRELGGECLYHDGCPRNGMDRLKRIVCQADIVVCITSLNSHAAVQVAKAMCKRNGKRLVVSKEAGINSLREILRETAM